MANNQLAKTNNNAGVATIDTWVNSENIRRKFNDVLDKGAGAFVTSLLSLVKASPQLSACDPKTIISASMRAATLKLPIDQNLGFAYLVPYKNEATFQLGYKGLIQLAMRTGQYKTINASVVREGEIEDIDFITGEIVRGKRKSEKIVGYVAYFKLVNGFEKTVYMSKEDAEAHANTFSMSYGADKKYGNKRSVWSTNFDAMALKTVLKQLISKYGIMSIDMQGGDMAAAIASDQAVIREDGTADYVDTEPQNVTPQEPQEFPEELQKNPNGHDIPATEENTSLDFGEPEF